MQTSFHLNFNIQHYSAFVTYEYVIFLSWFPYCIVLYCIKNIVGSLSRSIVLFTVDYLNLKKDSIQQSKSSGHNMIRDTAIDTYEVRPALNLQGFLRPYFCDSP